MKEIRSVYIAGPIAGHPNGNIISFRRAFNRLKGLGLFPVNPHDVDPDDHLGDCPPGAPAGQTGDGEEAPHTAPCYMRTDMRALLDCDAIYMLKGFEKSSGATTELAVAKAAGLTILMESGDALDAVAIESQAEWSAETFGPNMRPGVVEHIRKELIEIENSGYQDLEEWIDVMILAVDGAWRAGYSAPQILEAYHKKQIKNRARTWPDWQTASDDAPIEHDRTGEKESFATRLMKSGTDQMMSDLLDDSTLPEWLAQRFATDDWDEMSDVDKDYWKHQAAAVTRAVLRGGFRK